MKTAVAAAALIGGLWAASVSAQVAGPATGGAVGLAHAERLLGHTKRVLMVGAHPDDEDTELLAYLVRREGAVAGYLALTRGEGGQNLIGPELGEALGLIRTGELLAARRLDGARQFFTRAFDYGFSKRLEEALEFWPRDSLLKDAVRVVRRFRPQVMISIFSGTPRDGHGQHQAAGWVAREAFRAAGDANRFPELATEEGLAPWQPAKFYRSARFDREGTTLSLDGGVLDPEVGQSIHQIAMRGRSLHRSQDMGSLEDLGPSPIRLALLEDRTGGGSAIFAGLDTLPPRPGSVEASELLAPAAEAEAIRRGLMVDAVAERRDLVPGEDLGIALSFWNTGARPAAVRFDLRVPEGFQVTSDCLGQDRSAAPGAVLACEVRLAVLAGAQLSSPYFLRQERTGAWYRWSGPAAAWGLPFETPPVIATFGFEGADGVRRVLEREVTERVRNQAVGEERHPLAVRPRLDVHLAPGVVLRAASDTGAQRLIVSLLQRGRDSATGTVALDLPAGWRPVPPVRFHLAPGERQAVEFSVGIPPGTPPGDYRVRSVVTDERGRRYDDGVALVAYPHIRERGYLVAAGTTIRVADVRYAAGRRIGYVRGAADEVPEALAGFGVGVELLDRQALESGDLSRFDAIIVGSRAYEVEPALAANNGRLLDYVRGGGHLLVQYQQQAFFRDGLAPYPMTVAAPHDRITDETAPVRVLHPDDPVWAGPNRIGAMDWSGWVQERGLYFAHTWDPHFRPLIESNDPGEAPLAGGLLLADYGEGTYLYTGLSFFRQLRAGVPGAFRLFLNLLSIGSRVAVP